jgi:hypothetical protein
MAARKNLIHNVKSCGREFEILYNEENLPFLQCIGCGKVLDDWIKWHQEYRHYFLDDSRWLNPRDHVMCLLGYFCSKYREHYGVEYSLSLTERGLFLSAEVHLIRKIIKNLDSNVSEAKKYIDFYFATKVKLRKKKITSISVLSYPASINEFKFWNKKNKKIFRDKPLPKGMINFLKDKTSLLDNFQLVDYGDLKLLLMSFASGHQILSNDIRVFLDELKRQNVIDDELKIKNWSTDA